MSQFILAAAAEILGEGFALLGDGSITFGFDPGDGSKPAIVSPAVLDVIAARAAELEALPLDPPALAPSLYAVAQLGITPGEITGIDINSRFSAAIYLDVGLYYIFFAETQPNTAYLAKAYDAGLRVSVIERAEDFIVVTAANESGDPTDPAEISIEIIRVG